MKLKTETIFRYRGSELHLQSSIDDNSLGHRGGPPQPQSCRRFHLLLQVEEEALDEDP